MTAGTRNSCLDWLATQLANNHGIEIANDDLYWAVFLDAGCDVLITDAMIEEMSANPIALSMFAQTLGAFGNHREFTGSEFTLLIEDRRHPSREWLIDAVVIALVLFVGFAWGKML